MAESNSCVSRARFGDPFSRYRFYCVRPSWFEAELLATLPERQLIDPVVL